MIYLFHSPPLLVRDLTQKLLVSIGGIASSSTRRLGLCGDGAARHRQTLEQTTRIGDGASLQLLVRTRNSGQISGQSHLGSHSPRMNGRGGGRMIMQGARAKGRPSSRRDCAVFKRRSSLNKNKNPPEKD